MLESIFLLVNDFIIGASIGDLVKSIQDFVAPVLLGITSILAITFLFKRQFMQMLTFILFAVIVFAIFYAPEMLKSLGSSFGNKNKDLTFD